MKRVVRHRQPAAFYRKRDKDLYKDWMQGYSEIHLVSKYNINSSQVYKILRKMRKENQS